MDEKSKVGVSKGNVRALNFLNVLVFLIPLPLLTASLYFFGRSYIDYYNELWSIHNIGFENTFIDLVYGGFVLFLGYLSSSVIYICLVILLVIFIAMILRMFWLIYKERKRSKSLGNESIENDNIESFESYIMAMGMVVIIPVFIMIVLISFINARGLAEAQVSETKKDLDEFFNLNKSASVDFSFKVAEHASSFEKIILKEKREPIEGYVVTCSNSFCVIYVGIDQLEKVPINSILSRRVIFSQK